MTGVDGVRGSLMALLALSLVGCASLAPQQSDPLAEQIEALRATVISLQKKNTVTEVELQRLRVKVAELELAQEAVEPVKRSVVPSRPAPSLAQQGPEDPIDVARSGRIESTDLAPEPIAVETVPARPERIATRRSEIGTPRQPGSSPIESQLPAPQSAAFESPAPQAATPQTGGSRILSAQAQALYDEGYTQYNLREFVAAEATFQRYLQRFSDTSLADNALYWIAEARYSRGDSRGALASFRETVNRFPSGNKAPDALLRSGRVYEELGEEEAALSTYRELVERFPNSADALLGRDRIRALTGG